MSIVIVAGIICLIFQRPNIPPECVKIVERNPIEYPNETIALEIGDPRPSHNERE